MEVMIMKKSKMGGILSNVIAKVAYHEAKKNANSTCVFLHGQPEIPDSVKRLHNTSISGK